ncbi:dienelactone hydrolase family protein [Opitutales bacterium ASA1]|uniref:alpha/beta hydrolase n=1 Tax=Congregicoccus parvus TaxID=3081749 RepID=UPI002B2B7ACC|nr:dienelactone hydrolase family protein [Opitutales bacterium ASA1]
MSDIQDPDTLRFGARVPGAAGAVILVHGRGSTARDIAGLARVLPADGFTFAAPQAPGGTWYPQRFLAPTEANEPWLGRGLDRIERIFDGFVASGVHPSKIGLVGFSQGACLALEFAARRGRSPAFVAGLSGALIGPLDREPPSGSHLEDVPVLLACAELDAHIPLAHVEAGERVLRAMGAQVVKQVFPGEAHTVFPESIEWLRGVIESMKRPSPPRHRPDS